MLWASLPSAEPGHARKASHPNASQYNNNKQLFLKAIEMHSTYILCKINEYRYLIRPVKKNKHEIETGQKWSAHVEILTHSLGPETSHVNK